MPSSENMPGEDWILVVVPRAGRIPEHVHPVLAEYTDLGAQEAAANIKAGTPILISPRFEFDAALNRYLTSCPEFVVLNPDTRRSEATEIKTWLEFLESQQISWLDVEDEHFTDFRLVRTDADTVRRLITSGAAAGHVEPSARLPVVTLDTFAKGHIALRRLYRWARRQGLIENSPVPEQVLNGAASARSRRPKINWLLPATYELWRNVGLGGHSLIRDASGGLTWGEPDPSWKGGTVATRNQVFADLMITSALRRREQGTLLVDELPIAGADANLASAVAKFSRSRVYTPNAAVLERVDSYVRFQRQAAVRRAQAEGRYEQMAQSQPLHVVREVRRTGRKVRIIDDQGNEIDLDRADQHVRALMFTHDEGGLAPMMLWLTEAGRPMVPTNWNDVFDGANTRVARAFERLGVSEDAPRVNPHVLRYSFALYLLAALHRRTDEQEGYRETEAYDWKRYGTAYDVVKDMLGHKHQQTTVDTYLEPVKGLRRATLLNSTIGMDLAAIIGVLTEGSDRVLRTGSVFEGSGAW